MNLPSEIESSNQGITIQEATSAEYVEYWPPVSILDQNRRQAIHKAVSSVFSNALNKNAKAIGFFTLGLEVSRIPSWEIAEEIVRVIHIHSKQELPVERILIVAASPTQISSFQYALQNVSIISRE